MKQWEYDMTIEKIGNYTTKEAQLEYMNKYGQLGWELVRETNINNNTGIRYLWKREILKSNEI